MYLCEAHISRPIVSFRVLMVDYDAPNENWCGGATHGSVIKSLDMNPKSRLGNISRWKII